MEIKGKWQYLYRAVDSAGNTLDWMLSRYRNKKAAKRFFMKMLGNKHCKYPRVINIDKAKPFPPTFSESKKEKLIPRKTKLRRQKYIKNIQEHRFSKRRIMHSKWFQSFNTASETISVYKTMHMIHKGQVKGIASNDAIAQVNFFNEL